MTPWTFDDTLRSTMAYVKACEARALMTSDLRRFLHGLREWWAVEQVMEQLEEQWRGEPMPSEILQELNGHHPPGEEACP